MDKIVNISISSAGFGEGPFSLKIHITEDDSDVLDLLNIQYDQIVECRFSSAEPGLVSGVYGDNQYCEIGAILTMSDLVLDLSYEMKIGSEIDDALSETMQGLVDTMNPFGPMTAEYELFVSNGRKDLPP